MSNNIIDVLPVIALAAAAAGSQSTSTADHITVESASCSLPSMKRSHSLSLELSSSGEEDHVVLSAPTKRARGRPRSTQPLPRKTRKARKQDKVNPKSKSSTAQPVDLSANSTDGRVPLGAQSPSTAISSQTQDQLYRIVKHCLDDNISSDMKCLQIEVAQLKEMVVKLASRVGELNSQLSAFNFGSISNTQSPQPDPLPQTRLLSTLPPTNATTSSVVKTDDNDASSNVNISRQKRPAAPTQQRHDDAVTAMYLDQKRKQQRANNIIISGLPNSDNDTKTVTDLLHSEFEWDFPDWPGLNVTTCRRIGHREDNKVQPLLVTLIDTRQSEYFIRNAKFLRASSDQMVQSSVFINPDLTPSEARAAYELRLLRRQRRQQSVQHPGEQQVNSANSRIIYRSNNKLSPSANCPVASTQMTQAITPQPTPLPVDIPSRLVWSVQQPATAVSVITPPADIGEIIPASGSLPAEASSSSSLVTPNAVSDSHTKSQVGDSSTTIVAGSCP